MRLEKFKEKLLQSPKFHSAALNIEAHMRVLSLPPFTAVLVYYNQPIMYEVGVKSLVGKWQPSELQGHEDVYCLPFPCVEQFCPSFNAKNSLFIDAYKEGIEFCRSQFKDGTPMDFQEYQPISIRCFPAQS